MFNETIRQRLARYRHIFKHYVLYHVLDRKWMRETRKLRRAHKDQSCLIFATGPSVNAMDFSKIEARMKEGYKVFGINSFITSPFIDRIHPHFLVISDPNYLNDYLRTESGSDQRSAYWQEHVEHMTYIQKSKGLTLFMPHHWRKQVDEKGLFRQHQRVYFYHCENLGGSLNHCDLLKPRYYIAMTAYIGICVAAYLGFENIYLFGFDEDYINGLRVDSNNHLISQDRHFYAEPKERVTRNKTLENGQTLESFCLNVVKSCISQRRIHEDALAMGCRVVNANPDSYVTGFPKTAEFLSRSSNS